MEDGERDSGSSSVKRGSSEPGVDLEGEWGWGREDGPGLRQKGHPIGSLAGSPRIPMPRASGRRGWGRRQLSEDAFVAPSRGGRRSLYF